MDKKEEYYFDNEANIVMKEDTKVIEWEETRYMGFEEIPITFTVEVRVDKNGNPVSDMALDNKVSKIFIEEYRKLTGKMTTDEICGIRKKLGLSQRGLATLVGWSSSTIERYEKGSVPTTVNHKILESLSNLEIVKQYFETADKEKLSSKDLKVLQQLTNQSLAKTKPTFKKAKEIADWFIAENMKQLAIDPENTEPLTQMKLHKLAYLAQVYFIGENGYDLFAEEAQAFTHGPIFDSIRRNYTFENGREIKLNEEESRIIIVTQRDIENDEFVRKVLNDVWNEFSIYTAGYLRNLTHQKGTAWAKHYDGTVFRTIPKKDIAKDYKLYKNHKS